MEPIRNYSSGLPISQYYDLFVVMYNFIKQKKIKIDDVHVDMQDFVENDISCEEIFNALNIHNWNDRSVFISSVDINRYYQEK